MKKSRYTEEQIIGILKQHEAGLKTADLCREHGISTATVYSWKAKFGGMDVSEAQRLRQMEEENRRLKHLVADLSLDKEMLKAVSRLDSDPGKRPWSSGRSSAFRGDEANYGGSVALSRSEPESAVDSMKRWLMQLILAQPGPAFVAYAANLSGILFSWKCHRPGRIPMTDGPVPRAEETGRPGDPCSPEIDPAAPAGSENSLGAKSDCNGRPTTDDSVVEAIDEMPPAVTPPSGSDKGNRA